MKKIIFSNSSYLVSFGFENAPNEILKEIAKTFGVKYADGSDLSDLLESLEKIRHLVTILINVDAFDREALRVNLQALGPYRNRLLLCASSRRPEIIKKEKAYIRVFPYEREFFNALIMDEISKLCPRGFHIVTDAAIFQIKNFLFSNIGCNFELKDESNVHLDRYTHIILCDSNSDYGVISTKCYVNVNRFEEASPELQGRGETPYLDASKEFMNQVLGALGQNLRKVDLDFRLTLPTEMDNGPDVKIRRGFYIPYLSFVDDKGIFVVMIGYLNLSRANLDFSEVIIPHENQADIDFF